MSGMLDDRLRALATGTRRYPAAAYLFHRGGQVEHLHLILEGEAQLIRHHVDGRAAILQRARSKDILAEASFYSERYHCDGVAVRPVAAAMIPVHALRSAFGRDPGLGEAWAAHLARAVQVSRMRSEMLVLHTVCERLDVWLAGTDGGLPSRGDWMLLAAELGVTPEALYRELARRRREGSSGRSRPTAGSDRLTPPCR